MHLELQNSIRQIYSPYFSINAQIIFVFSTITHFRFSIPYFDIKLGCIALDSIKPEQFIMNNSIIAIQSLLQRFNLIQTNFNPV